MCGIIPGHKINLVSILDEYDGSSEESETYVYKQLDEVDLKSPIRLRMWIDSDKQPLKTNPQCVHWTTVRGYVPCNFILKINEYL